MCQCVAGLQNEFKFLESRGLVVWPREQDLWTDISMIEECLGNK